MSKELGSVNKSSERPPAVPPPSTPHTLVVHVRALVSGIFARDARATDRPCAAHPSVPPHAPKGNALHDRPTTDLCTAARRQASAS